MRIVRVGLLTLSALTTMSLLAAVAQAQWPEGKAKVQVEVMTRNIFLGADLGPALGAGGFEEFIEANGGILREVDETNFPLRAQGLAEEIKRKKPDLIGLQEVAWWRTGPVAIPPALTGGPFGAVTTEYDFLEILLDELEARGMSYDPAVVKDEFDLEAPADENNVDNDAPPGLFNPDPTTDDEGPGSLDDAELNGRLTMRDVILVNEESNVNATLSNPQTGTFSEPVHADDRRDSGGPGDPWLDRRGRHRQPRTGPAEGPEVIPLRQHPLRGVRRRDPGPKHSGAAGGRARRRPRQPRSARSSSATSTPTSRAFSLEMSRRSRRCSTPASSGAQPRTR